MNSHSRTLLERFASRRDAIVADLLGLVRLETPSHDGESIARFVEVYGGLLAAAGLATRELPGPHGPHLYAESPGEDPAVALVGHSDTVWPRGTVLARPPAVAGGKLSGPGAYDMKAGLVLILEVARALQEWPEPLRRRLQVFVSADEEKGSMTARAAMEELLAPGAIVLVPEPPCPDGSLKLSRKGVSIYTVLVDGRESHAGLAPDEGASAIAELARIVLEVHGWRDRGRGILVNAGTFSGGTASNVVAGSARSEIDFRFDLPEDGLEIDCRLRALEPEDPRARIRIEGGICFPPLVPTPASLELSALACRLARECGLEIGAGRSGGGSDGSFLASRGFTVLDGLGADGAGAHAPEEHIAVDRLPARAAFLTRLVLELGSR